MLITPSLRPPEPPLHPSRRDVLRRWEELEEWSCAYCDASFAAMVVAEVDHVRPLAKGGLHEWSNLVPACALCNRTKSDRDVFDFVSESTGESLTVDNGRDTQRYTTAIRTPPHDDHNVTSS
ncbi:HNH endonuclease signature motif containing protein [Streptomyces sp. NPDC026672]